MEGYIHPKWTGHVTQGNDVAVLKLNRKATNLTLPRLGSGNVPIDAGRVLAATGWGLTNISEDSLAKDLQVADHLGVIADVDCEQHPQNIDPDSWICAGATGEDTCKGHIVWSCLVFPLTARDIVRQVTLEVHSYCWMPRRKI